MNFYLRCLLWFFTTICHVPVLTPAAAVIGAASGVIGGVGLAPVLAPLALGALGFSAAGPVAGSFAAAVQASIGNVVAGSLFAGAQSVAMGGALPAAGSAIAGLISSASGLAAGTFWLREKADGDAAYKNKETAKKERKHDNSQLRHLTDGSTILTAASVGFGIISSFIGSVVIAPVAAPLAVGALGFGAAGPVAGTFAAAAQSSIGNVVAGSLFAGAQSVAMGGALPAAGSAIAGVISGASGLAASTFWLREKANGDAASNEKTWWGINSEASSEIKKWWRRSSDAASNEKSWWRRNDDTASKETTWWRWNGDTASKGKTWWGRNSDATSKEKTWWRRNGDTASKERTWWRRNGDTASLKKAWWSRNGDAASKEKKWWRRK